MFYNFLALPYVFKTHFTYEYIQYEKFVLYNFKICTQRPLT